MAAVPHCACVRTGFSQRSIIYPRSLPNPHSCRYRDRQRGRRWKYLGKTTFTHTLCAVLRVRSIIPILG